MIIQWLLISKGYINWCIWILRQSRGRLALWFTEECLCLLATTRVLWKSSAQALINKHILWNCFYEIFYQTFFVSSFSAKELILLYTGHNSRSFSCATSFQCQQVTRCIFAPSYIANLIKFTNFDLHIYSHIPHSHNLLFAFIAYFLRDCNHNCFSLTQFFLNFL